MTIDLKLVWEVMVTLVAGVAAVLGYVAVRSKKQGTDEAAVAQIAERLGKAEKAIVHHDGLLKDLGQSVAAMPTRHELAKLHDDIGAVRQELGNVSGRLEGIGRALDLINEHLINRSH